MKYFEKVIEYEKMKEAQSGEMTIETRHLAYNTYKKMMYEKNYVEGNEKNKIEIINNLLQKGCIKDTIEEELYEYGKINGCKHNNTIYLNEYYNKKIKYEKKHIPTISVKLLIIMPNELLNIIDEYISFEKFNNVIKEINRLRDKPLYGVVEYAKSKNKNNELIALKYIGTKMENYEKVDEYEYYIYMKGKGKKSKIYLEESNKDLLKYKRKTCPYHKVQIKKCGCEVY